ncbi:MAG: hypothetical protein L0229_23230 [Blastocatellia bacterium]|nr:hypothetical protein [Blastocatellia bacterium]
MDTEVCQPAPSDPTGWIRDHPTIWQYKAGAYRNISDNDMKKEINNEYSRNRIQNGYAYRLCVCDELPPERVEEWEKLLTAEARAINPDAPEAKVLSASSLADWASNLPAVALRYFLPKLATICLHLEAWKQSITEATPEFVPVRDWEDVQTRLAQHVNFSFNPTQVVLPISGEAGVGKTRLAYEYLASSENARHLVVYTSDEENAKQIAIRLANKQSLQAILVADECGVIGRVQLQALLNGARNRIRIITIDNSQERYGQEPLNRVERITPDTVEVILSRNFPDVPSERRRIYAGLSHGFVRLAADLCGQDGLIQSVGHVGPVLSSIQEYLRFRLQEERLSVLQALSLVTKVGMKGDVERELDDLCSLTDLDRRELKSIANGLHDGPGFVARGGRFFYVTPEIIAQAAFDMAWNRWAKHETEEFLARVPQSLLESFLKRVAKSANEEVRRVVGEFFRGWAWSLAPGQLASFQEVDRLVVLVEVEPDTYLPILRQLVEQASIEELKAVTGEGISGRWGPRRSLVWAAEALAAFPEHFSDAESILLRLTLAESEPQIANNATGIWSQLFGIVLSGTATPFPERLELLRERLKSEDNRVSSLAFEALNQVFNDHRSRMIGPDIVGGKIVPEEWRPKTNAEYKDCISRTVSLLQEFITASDECPESKRKAHSIALRHCRYLLDCGFLEKIKTIFDNEYLNDELRVGLIQAAEDFLAFDAKKELGIPPSYTGQVRDWLQILKPQDFHGKLVSLIGVDMWHPATLANKEEWQAQIQAMAIECLENLEAFKKEQGWLFSPQAQSAFLLGQELGTLDESAHLLDFIIESSVQFESTELARGYIGRLLNSFPGYADRVNQRIDKIQEDLPALAFELFTSGGDRTRALQRTLRLVESGKLSPRYLRQFVYYVGSRDITFDEIEQILSLLIKAIKAGDTGATTVAIEFLGYRSNKAEVWEHAQIRELAWQVLELTAANGEGKPYWWSAILIALADYDPNRATKIAASGLAMLDSRNFSHEDNCKKVIGRLAAKYPYEVMQHVGEVILDDQRGRFFYFRNYRDLIAALPDQVVIDWLENHGVEAARRLARHLPIPQLKANGATVPPLTEYVLRTFEDDEIVFDAFRDGVHDLQAYWGDIAAQHEMEAQTAEKFLNHPLKRIREWAQYEIQSAKQIAEMWRQHEEEYLLE